MAGRNDDYELTVAWGDCDPAQIAFYPNFFAWYDEATWHLFATAGLTREVLRARYGVTGIPLVKAGSEFRATVTAGDRLRIASRVARWGRSSFEVSHRVHHAGGAMAAEGFEVRVWAGIEEGAIRPLPIPDEVKALF